MKKTDGKTRTTARLPGLVHTRFVCNWIVRNPLITNTILPELNDTREILQNKKADNAKEKNWPESPHSTQLYNT